MKKIISILTAIFCMTALVSCGTKDENKDSKNEKINVIVSFYPLKEFTEKIGGDKVVVESLVKDGVEPHDFEPKAKDLEKLSKSDLFFYNGLSMEPWIDKVEAVSGDGVEIINTSTKANVIEVDGKIDPHIWLSLNEAKNQCEIIKDSLIKKDSKNKEIYTKNYNNYISKIDELYNKNKERFNTLKSKSFVTSHEAFGYLCRDFGLNQNSIQDIFGEGEITPIKLKDLIKYCKENNVKTIYMESLASPKDSETLANEVGAKVSKIYTLENKEDDLDYLKSMEYNLNTVYENLKNE